jgi:hypothetical protein
LAKVSPASVVESYHSHLEKKGRLPSDWSLTLPQPSSKSLQSKSSKRKKVLLGSEDEIMQDDFTTLDIQDSDAGKSDEEFLPSPQAVLTKKVIHKPSRVSREVVPVISLPKTSSRPTRPLPRSKKPFPPPQSPSPLPGSDVEVSVQEENFNRPTESATSHSEETGTPPTGIDLSHLTFTDGDLLDFALVPRAEGKVRSFSF